MQTNLHLINRVNKVYSVSKGWNPQRNGNKLAGELCGVSVDWRL